jgi:hypothetical protein
MAKKTTKKKAMKKKRAGKSPSTQAGEFVREEMEIKKSKKKKMSRKQAIAIGLSEARRAGVKIPKNPNKKKAKKKTKKK